MDRERKTKPNLHRSGEAPGTITLISLDLAVVIAVSNESLLRYNWYPVVFFSSETVGFEPGSEHGWDQKGSSDPFSMETWNHGWTLLWTNTSLSGLNTSTTKWSLCRCAILVFKERYRWRGNLKSICVQSFRAFFSLYTFIFYILYRVTKVFCFVLSVIVLFFIYILCNSFTSKALSKTTMC